MGPALLRLGFVLMAAGSVCHAEKINLKWKLALWGFVAIDLITALFALTPSINPAFFPAVNPTAEAIKADGERGRVFYFNQDEEAIKFGKYLAHNKVFDGFGPNNLSYWLGVREAVIPNAAMIDGVPSANNFDSLIVGRYQSVLDQINALPLDRALPLLSRMNVAYVVSPRVFDLPVVYQTPDATIYRNDAALPRAWIAPLDSDLAADSSVMPGSLVEALTDSCNIVTIRSVSPRDGWLILSDVWYPGWQASVDGVPTEIQVANQAFRAIRFPAGTHQVEFRYALVSAAIGGWITLGCALVVMVGLAMSFKR